MYRLIEARDLFFRLRNKIRRLILSKTTFNETQGKSDSQVTFYEQQLGRLLKSKKSLVVFEESMITGKFSNMSLINKAKVI